MANVLIAGCGYVGTALGNRLAAEGHTVWGLRRRPVTLPPAIRPFAADLIAPKTLQTLPPALDVVFYTAATDAHDDAAYRAVYVEGLRNVLRALDLQRQHPRRVLFTSSTGVYAQSCGEWVDETSHAEPADCAGIRLLEGECLLLEGPFPATVLRLGGIYGPDRAGLIEKVRLGHAELEDGSSVYFNRIYRDDAAGALHHLMTLQHPDHLYLGVDHEPAELAAVLGWLAEQLGVPPPRAGESPRRWMPRHGSNKRCRNARLVASGYVFRYPTFREGYAALLAFESPARLPQ